MLHGHIIHSPSPLCPQCLVLYNAEATSHQQWHLLCRLSLVLRSFPSLHLCTHDIVPPVQLHLLIRCHIRVGHMQSRLLPRRLICPLQLRWVASAVMGVQCHVLPSSCPISLHSFLPLQQLPLPVRVSAPLLPCVPSHSCRCAPRC